MQLKNILQDSDQEEQNRPEQKINNINSDQIRRHKIDLVNTLPFKINQHYLPTIEAHFQRIGGKRFEEIVVIASKARSPERYLMKCLVNTLGKS